MMRSKLGLSGSHEEDEKLISDLLDWMHKNQADYTNTFRNLGARDSLNTKFYNHKEFMTWRERWITRQRKNNTSDEAAFSLMKDSNPAVIPRNHNVEKALKLAEKGNFKYLFKFLKILKEPYKEGSHLFKYQRPPEPSERVYQTFCGT